VLVSSIGQRGRSRRASSACRLSLASPCHALQDSIV